MGFKVNNPSVTRFTIKYEHKQKNITLKPNPNFDRNMFSKGILQLKDSCPNLSPSVYYECLKY